MVNSIRTQYINNLNGNGITRQVKRAKAKLAKPKEHLKGGLVGMAIGYATVSAILSTAHAINVAACTVTGLLLAELVSGFDYTRNVIKDYKAYKTLKSTEEYKAVLNKAKQIKNHNK